MPLIKMMEELTPKGQKAKKRSVFTMDNIVFKDASADLKQQSNKVIAARKDIIGRWSEGFLYPKKPR